MLSGSSQQGSALGKHSKPHLVPSTPPAAGDLWVVLAVSVPSCLAAQLQLYSDGMHTPVWQGLIQASLTVYVAKLQELLVYLLLFI